VENPGVEPLVIDVEDPRADDVRSLIERHLTFNRSVTPPEGVFALEVEGLADPSVTFVAARRDGELVGIGALRQIDPHHAEVKSMHTIASARGQGVARHLLDHLLAIATERGCSRVSLETGVMDAYAPARALYAAAGFEPCGPFAEYVVNDTSAFMTRALP
jgi:putative acetyltransferase